MLLIGLNGRMHSGKDTAVQYIRDEANDLFQAWHGRDAIVRREGFADRLKLSAARALGFNPVSVEAAVEICNGLKENAVINVDMFEDGYGRHSLHEITGRQFLQLYGTESHRDVFGTNFWVEALLPLRWRPIYGQTAQEEEVVPVDDLFPNVDVLVVTDVRFENEASRILELGGAVWCIEADGRLGPLPEGAHASERPLPQELITRTVRNNGTLDEFKQAVSFATVEALSR